MRASRVSIPYRYATNQSFHHPKSILLVVSIPYRYATNQLHWQKRRELLLVSIPYRYATNEVVALGEVAERGEFQFLIGTLQTIATTCHFRH